MNKLLADLVRLLDFERLEHNLFRGESRDIGSPQVFGGQVLGQALKSASNTVDGRLVHSLHAYFLRRGDCNAPIVYEVDRSHDGKSFTSRRVVAIQHGQQIFHMSASFQVEPGGGADLHQGIGRVAVEERGEQSGVRRQAWTALTSHRRTPHFSPLTPHFLLLTPHPWSAP